MTLVCNRWGFEFDSCVTSAMMRSYLEKPAMEVFSFWLQDSILKNTDCASNFNSTSKRVLREGALCMIAEKFIQMEKRNVQLITNIKAL